MKKKGFTLIELLSIIVILSVISIIVTPIVGGYINKTKIESFKTSAINTMETAKIYVVENYEENDFPTGGISVLDIDTLKNNKYKSGIIKKNENGEIIVENLADEEFCANGSKNSLEIVKGSCDNNDKNPPNVSLKLLDSSSVDATVLVKLTDGLSGIKSFEYCYKDCDKNNYKLVEYTKPYNKEKREVLKLTGLSENTEYKLKVRNVKDGNDNVSYGNIDYEIKFKTIELEAAKFKITTSGYSLKKQVTIIYPKNNGSYKYKYIFNEEEKDVTNELNNNEYSFEVEESGRLTAIIEYESDGEIKQLNSTLNIVNVDKKGPDVSIDINPSGWSKSKIITVSAIDTGSGLGINPYRYNGGKWTKNKTLTINSNQKITLSVKDRLGNVTDVFKYNKTDYNEYEIDSIDNVSPRCSIEVIKSDKSVNINGTIWYKNPYIKVNAVDQYEDKNEKVVDGGSGIKSITLTRTVNGTSKPASTIKSSDEVLISDDGKNIIKANVTDNVGNVGTCSITINIDKTAPSCQTIGGSDTWKNTNITLTGKCTDSGVGCSSNSSLVVSQNGSGLYAPGNVCDKLGNCSSCPRATVKIDKVAPTCSSSGGTSSWVNYDVTIYGTCYDTGGSGCKGHVSLPLSYTTTKSPGTVCDYAGNCTACPVQTVYIDKVVPTVKWSISSDGTTAKAVCSDTGGSGLVSGTKSKTYKLTGTKDVTKEKTCKDNAGNSQKYSHKFKYSCKKEKITNCTTSQQPVYEEQITTCESSRSAVRNGVCSSLGGVAIGNSSACGVHDMNLECCVFYTTCKQLVQVGTEDVVTCTDTETKVCKFRK